MDGWSAWGRVADFRGGQYPFWSSDWKQLFYRSSAGNNRIFVVDYTARGDTFTAEKPRVWSETQSRSAGGNALVPIDLAPDGKHFAIFPMPQAEDERGSVHVTFLFNFFDELRRRMPAGK